MDKNIIQLKPIKENTSYYDVIEKKIKELFKKELYYPIFYILNLKEKSFQNSKPSALVDAIRFNKVFFSNDHFEGKFNAAVSKELRSYGAIWDKKTSTFKIKISNLPAEIRNVISTSKARFEEKIKQIDDKLSKISPEDMASKLHIAPQFDKTLWEVERDFQKSVEKIKVSPSLSDEQRKKVADEWQNNLRLYFKKYVSEEQIPKLRKIVQDNAYAGLRRENLIKSFMNDYNVSQNKAKFWARQETNLLMAKYKETKYVSAGVPEYRWGCVKMPHQPSAQAIYKPGEVRYSHGILEGKIFSWNDPPITTPPGQPQRRNNPGQDYNCRCFAIPIVRFKK